MMFYILLVTPYVVAFGINPSDQGSAIGAMNIFVVRS